MEMQDEEQIRQVIALQKQIEEDKKEVSRLVEEIMKRTKLDFGSKIVFDGELWEITRWPFTGAPRRENFLTWKLTKRGKVLQ